MSAPATVASVDRNETLGRRQGSGQRIEDIDVLRDLLQCAIELEHSTLPPYMCALYSLDRTANPAATETMLSILVEEMLHLTLAANLLNAIGGRPVLDHPRLLPGYPRLLPHGDGSCSMSLLPFGREALAQFALVERPAGVGAPAQWDQYETIGQFYGAIRQGLIDVAAEIGDDALFCGDPQCQIPASFAYGGSGRIVSVDSLTSALAALDEIVEQGEGAERVDVWDGATQMFHPERDEVAHFYRINELLVGRRYRRGDTPASGPSGESIAVAWGEMRPMRPNPRMADHPPESALRHQQHAFNASYSGLLADLEHAFNGHPEQLGPAVGAMYRLKAQAEELMHVSLDDGTRAGPTFEWVPTGERG